MKIFIALFLAVFCTLQSGAARAKPAPQTRDNWRSIRTNNLFVIGGASRMLGGESGGMVINDGQLVAASGSLPTVDEVLKRFVEAMGGATAIKAVNSRTTKGTLDVAGISRGGSFEWYAVAPNKSLTVIQARFAKLTLLFTVKEIKHNVALEARIFAP